MTFLRRKWQQKPKQWGPVSAVQSALRDNLERIGIDFKTIKLAAPAWEQTGGITYNYTDIQVATALEGGAAWGSDGVACVTDGDVVDTNLTALDLFRSDADDYSQGSFIFSYRKLGVPATAYYFMSCDGFNLSLVYDSAFYFNQGTTKSYIGASSGVPAAQKLTDGGRHTIGLSFYYGLPLDAVIDSTHYSGTTNAGSTNSYKTYNVYFGGRPSITGRYCAGEIGSVLASNGVWTQDELMLLSEHTDQIWQPVPRTTYFIPSGSTLLPIMFNHYNKNIGT